MISVTICARIDPLDPSALRLVAADPGIYTGRAHPRYQDPPARRGGAGISTGRRTRQILSVSSVAPVSSWSRQQAEKRIRVAARALFENRADNKLARMSVVMLHAKTVAFRDEAEGKHETTKTEPNLARNRKFESSSL